MKARAALRCWALATALLAAARQVSSDARPAAAAVSLDAHTIEFEGRLYVALDAPEESADRAGVASSDERPRRRLSGEGERLPPFTSEWFAFVAMASACVICAAFAAGLTMGLVALDPMQLQITLHMDVRDCSNGQEREDLLLDQKCAERVLPLIENHHLLLVTLLLVNAGANEALPIFLDALLPSWAAILVSVTGVLIFGEIIPSAIFTGPNQLRIASALSPLVYALIALASPIAYPLAVSLDYLLGDAHTQNAFKRQELRAIMKMAADEERRAAAAGLGGRTTERRVSAPFWLGTGGNGSSGSVGTHEAVTRPSLLVSQNSEGHQVRRASATAPLLLARR